MILSQNRKQVSSNIVTRPGQKNELLGQQILIAEFSRRIYVSAECMFTNPTFDFRNQNTASHMSTIISLSPPAKRRVFGGAIRRVPVMRLLV